MEDNSRWFVLFCLRETSELNSYGRFDYLSYEEALKEYDSRVNNSDYDEVYLVKLEKSTIH